MAQQHTDKEFFGQRVKLDGNRYARCTFVNCIIVYGGGLIPELVDVVFENSTIRFEGAARRTLEFMRVVYQNGSGGREVMEKAINTITE